MSSQKKITTLVFFVLALLLPVTVFVQKFFKLFLIILPKNKFLYGFLSVYCWQAYYSSSANISVLVSHHFNYLINFRHCNFSQTTLIEAAQFSTSTNAGGQFFEISTYHYFLDNFKFSDNVHSESIMFIHYREQMIMSFFGL